MPFSEPIDPRDHADTALLDSAVNRPFQTFDGSYLHTTLAQQASALFHSMVCNHCFSNGNKRTAVMALDMFMTANGFCLLMSNDHVYAMSKATAEANLSRQGLDDVLQRIASAVNAFSVPFEALNEDPYQDIKNMKLLYLHCLEERKSICTNP